MTNVRLLMIFLFVTAVSIAITWINKEVDNEKYWIATTYFQSCAEKTIPPNVCETIIPFIRSDLDDNYISNWEWLYDLPLEYRELNPYIPSIDYKAIAIQNSESLNTEG